jgi:competence protein ComEC
VPVACAAWAGSWIGTGGGWPVGVGVAVGIVVVAMATIRRVTWAAAVGIVLVGCLAVGGARAWQADASPLRELAARAAVPVLEGEITGEPRVFGGMGAGLWTAPMKVTRVTVAEATYAGGETVRLSVRADRDLAGVVVGSKVRVVARLAVPVQTSSHVADGRVKGGVEVIAGPGPILTVVERVRQGLRDAVAGQSPTAAALVPALVVGDTSALPPDLTADFAATGLTHLNAVSGANLTLLLSFLGLVARWLGARGGWLRALSLAGTAGFVVLCRGEPSVIRAAVMGLVALAAMGRHRGSAGLRPLGVAIIAVMVVDPWMSRSWGFALSALATGGIIGFAGDWADRLRWLPRWCAEAVALPLAAGLATQPAVSALSGSVSLVAVAANVIAGPLVGPATVLGFGAALCGVPFPAVAAVLGWCAGRCALAIAAIAHWFAAAPGAQWDWPTNPWALAVLTGIGIAIAVVMPQVLSTPGRTTLAVLVVVAASLIGPLRPGWPPSSWDIMACDVGQGDAFLIRAGPRSAVMVDTGPEPADVADCLRQAGVDDVPLLILTHDHADHIGGLDGVLAAAKVGLVVVNPATATQPASLAVQAAATRAGAAVRTATAGDLLTAGEVTVRVLDTGPPGPAAVQPMPEGESSAENDASTAVVLTRAVQDASVPGTTVSMLCAGDREPAGQIRLLAAGIPQVDVLAVPHHGSRAQHLPFITGTGASVALIGVGARNPYGHPARPTVNALAGAGMTVLRTDQDGTTALSRRGADIVVTSVRDR